MLSCNIYMSLDKLCEVGLFFVFRFSFFAFRYSFFIFRYSLFVFRYSFFFFLFSYFDIQNPILTFEMGPNIVF